MSNGGNHLIEALKKGVKNLPSKSSLGFTSSLILPKNQNYNPNHTDSGRTVELIKNNLNNLKIQPTLNLVVNKPKNISNDLKTFITNPLLGTQNDFNIDIPEINNIENNTGILEQNLPQNSNNNIPKVLDYDLEFQLLEYEGYDQMFLTNVSRLLNLIKSPNPDLSNKLELNFLKSFESSKNFNGPSHLSMMLRSIYKNNKTLNYHKILKKILKMLNNDLPTFNTHKEDNIKNESIIFDKSLEDDIESLLRSIQESNYPTNTDSTSSNTNKLNEYNEENKKEKEEDTEFDADIDYGKEYIYEKTETNNYVTLLSSETLAKLTSYDQNQISDICKILEINENKLSVEEAQFILDEISTLKGDNIGYVDEKYKIVEKNGKYYSESIKSHWVKRPIVVTVMGHVDHGKTSLLDYIHKTDVAKNEKGFITQKISTFQINSKAGRITFIDTPGHAAFLTMRKRGVSCTDLVILVIAADDGIMPQTMECIDLIKNNDLQVLVAINKVDLAPKEAIEKIAQDIRTHFKDATVVNISARTGLNVDLLLSEVESIQQKLDLKMDKNSIFKGYIYETLQDSTKGKCVNIITKQGSLQPNDYVLINDSIIKVKKIHYPSPNNHNISSILDDDDNNNVNIDRDRDVDINRELMSRNISNEVDKLENDENDILQINVGMNVSNLAGNVIVGHKSLKQLQKYQDLMNKQMSKEEQVYKEGSQEDLKCIPFVGINLRCADQGSLEAIENYINEFNENVKKSVNVRNLIERKYLPSILIDGIDIGNMYSSLMGNVNSSSGNKDNNSKNSSSTTSNTGKSTKSKKSSNSKSVSTLGTSNTTCTTSNSDSNSSSTNKTSTTTQNSSSTNTIDIDQELRNRYQPYIREWTPFKIISKNLGDFNTNDLQLQQIGNIVNIGFNIQNHMNLENVVRTHDIIYNIFNDLQLIYEFYFGDLYRKKIESNLIVTQVGSISLKGVGKKQAVGTSVKEGQSKLNHYYSVIRDNHIIYNDLNVISFQSNKLNVKVLNKGDNNNCLIFKENVTVQLNDEIVAYIKQPLLPLFDSITNHILKT